MIKHIVMWQFKEGTQSQAREFLDRLAGLYGQIPELKQIENGINVNPDNTFSAVSVMLFDSLEALNVYKKDPRHVQVSALCKSIRVSRAAVDYEV